MSARHPPPQTESQTGVKTLPCRNYVADGKNVTDEKCQSLDKANLVSAQGISAQEGVCPGRCLPRRMSAQGVSARGCLPHPHPPVDRMTDACENITFPHYITDCPFSVVDPGFSILGVGWLPTKGRAPICYMATILPKNA